MRFEVFAEILADKMIKGVGSYAFYDLVTRYMQILIEKAHEGSIGRDAPQVAKRLNMRRTTMIDMRKRLAVDVTRVIGAKKVKSYSPRARPRVRCSRITKLEAT